MFHRIYRLVNNNTSLTAIFRPSCKVLNGSPNFKCSCNEKCNDNGQYEYAIAIALYNLTKVRKAIDQTG